MEQLIGRMKKILEDKTPIVGIHFDHAQLSVYVGGGLDVTKIEAYPENGQMAEVPWIAVWKGDNILYRIPANLCRIEYEATDRLG